MKKINWIKILLNVLKYGTTLIIGALTGETIGESLF